MSRDKIYKKDKMSDLCPSTYTRFRLLTERQIRDKLGTNQGQIRDKLGTNQGQIRDVLLKATWNYWWDKKETYCRFYMTKSPQNRT